MEKKLGLILIIGIGGIAAYHLLKKPAKSVNFHSSIEEISREIEADANVEKVQPELPRLGVPRNMMQVKKSGVFKNSYTSFANAAGHRNYVDVKHNAFFKPELGAFHK
jgi:hypothetical protein